MCATVTRKQGTSSTRSFKRSSKVLYHCKYVSPSFSPSPSLPSLKRIFANSSYSGTIKTLRGRNRNTDHKLFQTIPKETSFSVSYFCKILVTQKRPWEQLVRAQVLLLLCISCRRLPSCGRSFREAENSLKHSWRYNISSTGQGFFFFYVVVWGWKELKTLGNRRNAIINIMNPIYWTQ